MINSIIFIVAENEDFAGTVKKPYIFWIGNFGNNQEEKTKKQQVEEGKENIRDTIT
jgi:hypothetical protein